jgi:hypothetical protein
MRHIAPALFSLLLSAVLTTSAQADDHIRIYGDEYGSTCVLALRTPGPVSSYVVHKVQWLSGTTGSRWKVSDTSTLTATSASSPFTFFGDPYTDLSVGYGGCRTGIIHIMTLTHVWSGQPVSCGRLTLGPPPVSTTVLTTDCDYAVQPAKGGVFYFDSGNHPCCPEPTETTSWGAVKALYR